MREIARVERTSTASAGEFHARWCDLETHPDWAPSMEYFRLHDGFGLGATGVSRPRGGEEAPFTVTALEPPFVYADTTHLDGADLTVHHRATPIEGGCLVVLTAWVEGPLEADWAVRLSGVRDDLERDLVSLAAMLEDRRPLGRA